MDENKTYSDLLKDPRWQKKRLKILERDEWTCQLCYSEIHTLHIHHLKYNGLPWEAKDEDLLTVCERCHYWIELDKEEFTGKTIAELRDRRVYAEFWLNDEFRKMTAEVFVRLKKIENKIHMSYLLKTKEDEEDII